MRAVAAGLLAVLASAASAGAEPVEVSAKRITAFSRAEPDRTTFGPLTFRGGLVLTATSDHFGGFSGLRVAADGEHFWAVSDRARWFSGRIVYEGATAVGVADVDLAPVLGRNGQPLAGTRSADTEALEIEGETAWVGTERKHQVLRFNNVGAEARGVPVATPKAFGDLPLNEGIEALGLVPGGPAKDKLLAVAEAGLNAEGNHRAWLLAGRTEKPARELSVKRRDEYAVTDLDFLPDGDLVLLERRYLPPLSLTMRLRRIKQADIAPGAVLDGEVLLEASLIHEIDNMEGLSVHAGADGAAVLTLISDNNFLGFQRTVLLQFGLVE